MKNELGQFIPVHYHYQMLSDSNRTKSFKKAIDYTVRKGNKVAELGCGTGILSFFAANSGGLVKGIEYNSQLLKKAQKLLTLNGVEDQVALIESDAKEWMSEEPIDVVICEMLHSALLREKQVEVIDVFAKKHFEKFGKIPRFIPEVTMLGVQAVYQLYEFEGYNAPIPLFYDPYLSSNQLLECSQPALYSTLIYDELEGGPIIGDVALVFDKDCIVNALRFITKNLLYTNRISGETVDWHNQYMVLPLDNPITVKSHEKLRVTFTYKAGDSIQALEEAINVRIEEN